MRTLWSFIILLLLSGQGGNLFAQWHCGTPLPTNQEKKQLLAQYQNFIQQKNSGKFRTNNYKVALKVNIISGTNTLASAILSEADIKEIIANANTYLQNINVELYLLGNQTYTIKDDRYAEFKINDEAELRRKYDVQNAINIYFAKNITLTNLTVLSGYATLPSAASNSNRIFYSYFERSANDFQNLKNKTFLHELGHYFGLLHTFQDSNSPDESERELVTRGAGSNCAVTGDQLFDTPADPFERLPISSAFECTNTSPADIVDVNGEKFTPATNNIMSYYQGCGNVFTEQQYLKMQASFAVRFSPTAEYTIAGQTSSNFLSIRSLNKSVYCAGDSVQVSYNLTGLFEEDNQFIAEISDNTGKNYQVIESKLRGSRIVIPLSADLPAGENYHIRIRATRPETTSPISESFAVRNFATGFITSSKSVINAGETVDLTVNLGGSGTWSFELSDGTSVKDTRQTIHTFTRTLNESTFFSIRSLRNMCGEGTRKQGTGINVTQPQIQTTGLTSSTICQGQTIKLSITISGSLSFDNQLSIQISDASGLNFTDLPTQVSLFSLSAQIPAGFRPGSGYRLKVVAKNSSLFSAPIGPLTIASLPDPPAINPVFNICQNSTPQILSAKGSDIKWYVDEYDLKSYNSLVPSTTKEGTFTYYVTQTNNFGCESNKARVEVNIRAVPTATLSGDNTILLGDSTVLKVNVTGSFPALVTLSDGKNFAVRTSPFIVGVKPAQTTTYQLSEARNDCGTGPVSGSARIIILEPLATEEPLKDGIRVFPNPASEQLTLEYLSAQPATSDISLLDMTGKVLQQNTTKVSQGTQEFLDLKPYTAGHYILRIKTGEKSINRKITIER
jgi:predicted Zn-dependent protease